jgi:hypothetical protein
MYMRRIYDSHIHEHIMSRIYMFIYEPHIQTLHIYRTHASLPAAPHSAPHKPRAQASPAYEAVRTREPRRHTRRAGSATRRVRSLASPPGPLPLRVLAPQPTDAGTGQRRGNWSKVGYWSTARELVEGAVTGYERPLPTQRLPQPAGRCGGGGQVRRRRAGAAAAGRCGGSGQVRRQRAGAAAAGRCGGGGQVRRAA